MVQLSWLRAFVVVLLLYPSSSFAENRVALDIGNSAYCNVPELANPRNDAVDMPTRLEGLGFHVVQGEDLDLDDCRVPFSNLVSTGIRNSGVSALGERHES